MQDPKIYNLNNIKRLFRYPYPLFSVGWMPHHLHIHKNACIQNGFICISGNWEDRFTSRYVNGKLSQSFLPAAGFFSFGILPPGTRLHTVHGTYHDELFFEYTPDAFDRLMNLLFPVNVSPESFRFRFIPNEIVIRLRKTLLALNEPGAADKVDQLATALFTEIITKHVSGQQEKSSRNSMQLYEIAAHIAKGKEIPALLKEYGMSERSFYREWEKCFSIPPAKYKTREQINQACYLLKYTNMTHDEIRLKCGFATINYFYQKFRKATGMSPGDYRKTLNTVLLPENTEE